MRCECSRQTGEMLGATSNQIKNCFRGLPNSVKVSNIIERWQHLKQEKATA